MHAHQFIHFHAGGFAWLCLFLFAMVVVAVICQRSDGSAKSVEADQPRRLNP
jgi:hypothetical protein